MLPNHFTNPHNMRAIYPAVIVNANRINAEQAQRNLFAAIEYANEEDFMDLCEKAIAQGADINGKNASNDTAIESAIKRGNLRILRYLFARGAISPQVNYTEEDIVMLAAITGNAEIVEFLIHEIGLLPDVQDAQGATALHRAAAAGDAPTLEILLTNDSDPNTLSSAISPYILKTIFDKNLHEFGIFSQGENITALMIATAQKNYECVKILIKNHANVGLGAAPPLFIAIKNNDEYMIKILSRAGAYSDQYPILNGSTLLDFAIKNNCHVRCLQCLIDENSEKINTNSEKFYALLGFSIQKNRLDYLAALLPISTDIVNEDDYKNLYMLALNSPNKNNILSMLAFPYADFFEKKISSSNSVNFADEFHTILTPYKLSLTGIFPPAVNEILNVFAQEKEPVTELTTEQINFALAEKLAQNDLLRKKLFSQEFLAIYMGYIDLEWLNLIEKKFSTQLHLLHQAANKILNIKNAELERLFSVDFIKKLMQSNKSRNEVVQLLESEFTQKVGLPRNFAQSFAQIYQSGFDFAISANPQNYDTHELASLTQKIIINILSFNSLHSTTANGETASGLTTNLLERLHENQPDLEGFYINPVEVIRKLENRHNLRPAKAMTLQKQLALHMGLPPQFCQYILKAWANSISKTRQLHNLATPVAINQSLKHHFSSSLLEELEVMMHDPDIFKEKLLLHAGQQLKNWCISQLAPSEMSLGKRSFRNDYEEPNAKRQRH